MTEHALMCPQCNAPLTPSRFAHTTVCSYCGATVQLDESVVSAERFHQAFRIWNAPQTYQITSWISLHERHWALGQRIGQGEVSDVYAGQRARWPTELVIIKILRDRKDVDTFDNEWHALLALQQSDAPGADMFTTRLPQTVAHGEISDGLHRGQRVSIFRWISGFQHTLEHVMQAYPQGIPPRASIWVWRRVLETLAFIHASGMAHGAVLPPHLLVHEADHGARLIGYGCAGPIGDSVRAVAHTYKAFYPRVDRGALTLTPQLDLMMSARCMAALLGGDPGTGALPAEVPAQLARIVRQIANGESARDAWALREALGGVARQIFGPPRFVPLVIPS